MPQIYRTMRRHPFFFSVLLLLPCISRAQSHLPPEPYGGTDAVHWMLDQEMVFPEAALAAGTENEVAVAFDVLRDGTTRNMRVTKPLDPACDAEALRLVKLIRWLPATTSGTPLDTDHSIAIPFSAKKYRKAHAKASCERPPFDRPADASGKLYGERTIDTLAVPLVKGGIRGLPAYISGNLKYPQEAFRRDIQGKVTIEFVVETSGNLSNVRPLEFLGAGCDDEAMRLIRSICWMPAIEKGQRVRSILRLDIQFRLDPSKRP